MAGMVSAGLTMYRIRQGMLEILLGHPGGPYYIDQDAGCWGIPKGQVEAGETLLEGAIREFSEETGLIPVLAQLTSLGSVVEASGKVVHAWAFCGDCDTSVTVDSNLFELEWPAGSGKIERFPEMDRLAFFTPLAAVSKIEPVQLEFVRRLQRSFVSRRTAIVAGKSGYYPAAI